MPIFKMVVLGMACTRAMIEADRSVDVSQLISLAFTFADHVGERKISDLDDRAYVVKELIALGAVFYGGGAWSPAEVVDCLRDQGRVNAKFRRVDWVSPNTYVILGV